MYFRSGTSCGTSFTLATWRALCSWQQTSGSRAASTISVVASRSRWLIWSNVFPIGNIVRDFFYVGDMARALLLAADERVESGVYNIGGGQPITLADLVECISDREHRAGLLLRWRHGARFAPGSRRAGRERRLQYRWWPADHVG